jgi:hypothetical protein
MPDRLTRVEIPLSRGAIDLPFESRNELPEISTETAPPTR